MSALKMNLTTKATMSALYKSACQQHSSAKVNCCFSEGMQEKEPANLCVCILWKIWPDAEKGYSYWCYYITDIYEAASTKVTEFARSRLSYNYANTLSVDFNWADVFRRYVRPRTELKLQTPWQCQQKRHYRHEKETFTILSATDTVDF